MPRPSWSRDGTAAILNAGPAIITLQHRYGALWCIMDEVGNVAASLFTRCDCCHLQDRACKKYVCSSVAHGACLSSWLTPCKRWYCNGHPCNTCAESCLLIQHKFCGCHHSQFGVCKAGPAEALCMALPLQCTGQSPSTQLLQFLSDGVTVYSAIASLSLRHDHA